MLILNRKLLITLSDFNPIGYYPDHNQALSFKLIYNDPSTPNKEHIVEPEDIVNLSKNAFIQYQDNEKIQFINTPFIMNDIVIYPFEITDIDYGSLNLNFVIVYSIIEKLGNYIPGNYDLVIELVNYTIIDQMTIKLLDVEDKVIYHLQSSCLVFQKYLDCHFSDFLYSELNGLIISYIQGFEFFDTETDLIKLFNKGELLKSKIQRVSNSVTRQNSLKQSDNTEKEKLSNGIKILSLNKQIEDSKLVLLNEDINTQIIFELLLKKKLSYHHLKMLTEAFEDSLTILMHKKNITTYHSDSNMVDSFRLVNNNPDSIKTVCKNINYCFQELKQKSDIIKSSFVNLLKYIDKNLYQLVEFHKKDHRNVINKM